MMKKSQKMLVIVQAKSISAKQSDQPVTISFYSTADNCRTNVGQHSDLNKAVYEAYWAFEDSRKINKGTNGIGGSWNGYWIQLNMVPKS